MNKYGGVNLHGDARILLGLGGIPKALYYQSGISTANQQFDVNISRWTITNNSIDTPLLVVLSNIDGTTTSITIPFGESINFDIIVTGIELVTAGISYVISGQEIEPIEG